jgi:hypothetical protein
MMPHEPLREMMRRTMANLEFVEHHKGNSGPFEVTQLINSFLGALSHPWERLKQDLMMMPLTSCGDWPLLLKERPKDYDPTSLGDAIRLLRNGIAHGNIVFLPGPQGEIKAIRVWNENRGRRDWGTVLTIADLRCFLVRFVGLADTLADQEATMQPRIA